MPQLKINVPHYAAFFFAYLFTSLRSNILRNLRNIMPQRGTNVLQCEAKNKMVSIHAAIYISPCSPPLYKFYNFFYYEVRLFLAYIAHI
jgi:hypothetical protein